MYGMQLLVEAYRQLSGTAEDGVNGIEGKQTSARTCVRERHRRHIVNHRDASAHRRLGIEIAMATYDAKAALPNDEAGPWGDSVKIAYDQRDVLLYATGVGTRDLRFVYERHPEFSVFPTFAIRWGGAGAPIDRELIPNSPGPLNIDAERYLEVFRTLPLAGDVSVRSRLIGAHPRGKGNGFVECESEVCDAEGNPYLRMVNGSFRRGVETLGDIEPFEGAGRTFSEKITLPDREPDIVREAPIPDNQAPYLPVVRRLQPSSISTRKRRVSEDSTNPSSMACAPSAIARTSCSMRSAMATQHAFERSRYVSRPPCFWATRCRFGPGTTATAARFSRRA